MRASIIFLLVFAVLLASNPVILPKIAPTGHVQAEESSSTTTAWESLVQAYSNVKTAESDGASHDSIVRLSGELEIALNYYENSSLYATEKNATLADRYATLSTSQSSNVTIEANALDATARSHTLQRQALAYTIAFVLAAISSMSVVEKDRLEDFLQRKKVIRT